MSGWGLRGFRNGGVAAVWAAAAFFLLARHRPRRKCAALVSPQSTASAPLAAGHWIARRDNGRAKSVGAGAAGADRAIRSRRPRSAGGRRALWPRCAAYQRRPDLARLCGKARCHRHVSSDQGGPRVGADFRVAARQLCRPCEPRAGERRQGGPAARRDGARSVRNSRRRHAARGPRRRRAHPDRTNIVRDLYR